MKGGNSVQAAQKKSDPLSYTAFKEEDISNTLESEEIVLARIQDNSVKFISEHFRKVNEDLIREIVDQAFITGKAQDIDPLLILAIIATESSFNAKASSPAGAKGLMQVHARVHADKFRKYGGLKAAHDVTASIEVGTQILKSYLNKTGTLTGALKYYVGAARKSHDGGYSRKVLAMRKNLEMAAAGEIQAAKIQAKAPSRIPDDHKDHMRYATYSSNLKGHTGTNKIGPRPFPVAQN